MPDDQTMGEAQEASVRARLLNEGYTQPYGASDDQIRKGLRIRGKCADFVGYHTQQGRWLIAESKGSNMDAAYYQLMNTMKGLLAKEPTSKGKTDLQIYTSHDNYKRLIEDERGLSGSRLRDGLLGYFDESKIWHYAEIQGVRIQVVWEQGQ